MQMVRAAAHAAMAAGGTIADGAKAAGAAAAYVVAEDAELLVLPTGGQHQDPSAVAVQLKYKVQLQLQPKDERRRVATEAARAAARAARSVGGSMEDVVQAAGAAAGMLALALSKVRIVHAVLIGA